MEVSRIWATTEIGHGICISAYFLLVVTETACEQSQKGEVSMADVQRLPKLYEHIFQIKIKSLWFKLKG